MSQGTLRALLPVVCERLTLAPFLVDLLGVFSDSDTSTVRSSWGEAVVLDLAATSLSFTSTSSSSTAGSSVFSGYGNTPCSIDDVSSSSSGWTSPSSSGGITDAPPTCDARYDT